MQQIQIDAIGAQALERRLACGDDTAAARMMRQHLADDEQALAHVGERVADKRLGRAVAVHLRGIDERHAEIDALAQRGDLGCALRGPLAHFPGALPELRYAFAAGQRDGFEPAGHFVPRHIGGRGTRLREARG